MRIQGLINTPKWSPQKKRETSIQEEKGTENTTDMLGSHIFLVSDVAPRQIFLELAAASSFQWQLKTGLVLNRKYDADTPLSSYFTGCSVALLLFTGICWELSDKAGAAASETESGLCAVMCKDGAVRFEASWCRKSQETMSWSALSCTFWLTLKHLGQTEQQNVCLIIIIIF